MNDKLFFDRVTELSNKHPRIYIYGAGLYARNLHDVLNHRGKKIDGFLVTNSETVQTLNGLPVTEFRKLDNKGIGIILGVNRHNAEEILTYLHNNGVQDSDIINGSEYIDNNGVRGGLR